MASKVIANLIALIGADTSGFEAGLNTVQGGLGGVIKGLGGVALAGALAFGSGQMIGQAAEFESTLKNIQSISGMTGDQINQLGQDLLAIGADSVAGPQAVAAAYNDIVGGVADASTHMAILNASIAMAEAGQADLGASTNGLISVMNSYGYSAAEAATVSDVFTQTVGMGVGSMDEFVAAMSPISGMAATAGVKFENLGAMMAFMTTKGTSASQSATQIKAAMTSLLNPNEKMKAALKAAGIESGSAALQMYGLEGTLKLVKDAMGGSTDAMAGALGSTEALQGAIALTDEGYGQFLSTFEGTMGGITDAARAVQLESFNAQWAKLQNTMGAVATGVGLAVLPALTAVASGINQFAQDVQKEGLGAALQKWFNAGVDWLKNEAPGIFKGALASAVALGTDVFAWFTKNGPDIIAGVRSLIEGARDWLVNEGPEIFEAGMKAVLQLGSGVVEWVKANGPDILAGIKTWFEGAVATFSTDVAPVFQKALGDGLKAVGSLIEIVKANAPDVGFAVGEWLKGGLSGLGKIFQEALTNMFKSGGGNNASLSDTLRGQSSGMEQALNPILEGVKNLFGSVFGPEGFIAGLVEGLLGKDKGTIKVAFDQVFGAGGILAVAIEDGKKIIQTFIDKVGEIAGGIAKAFEGVLEIITKPFREAIDYIGKILIEASKAGGVFEYLGGLGQGLRDAAGIQNVQYNEPAGPPKPNANGGRDISGWSMVGERGPEPAYFGGGGGRVIRNSRAQGMMGGNATVNITVNNQTDGYTLVEQMRRELKSRNIQIEGLTT